MKKFIFLILILTALVILFTGGCSLKTDTENLKDQLPSTQEITKEVAGVRITTGGQKSKKGLVPVVSLSVINGSAEIPRGVWGDPVLTEKMFSSNGEWVAFTGSRNDKGQGLWAVAMNGSQGNLLAAIEEKEHTGGTLMINLLGWTDKNKVLFTRQGTQPFLNDELFLCRYTDKKKNGEITREEEIYRIHGTRAVQLTFDGGEKPDFGLAGDWLVYTQQSKPEEDSRKIVILQLPKVMCHGDGVIDTCRNQVEHCFKSINMSITPSP
ncbi:MAG: hypothetical protein STSR0004_00450 [Peptococcaceae bacterium]